MNLDTYFNVMMIKFVVEEIEDHGGNLPPQWANFIGRYTNNKKMEVTQLNLFFQVCTLFVSFTYS